MTGAIPEAEAYIQFRLHELSSRNEHHRFEEIATRIARRRISANIMIATGPVSSGGDQGRDAETFTTRIPAELPNAAGFSASASTAPVVLACTVQSDKLRGKVLADLEAICAPGADPVEHVAYFSVHPISEGITHALKKQARERYKVTLDVFCGADIATFLAEPDLVWVARHYLDLPSSMVPPPEDDPAPQWYVELLEKLRQHTGPAALTPATQGEITQGLRFATWERDANADLPEWLDYMSAFLVDSDDGADTELVFRACYEMAVARFRGTGSASGVEDLVRRAIKFACTSEHPNIVDDAVVLASYWGGMWSSGVGRAGADEIGEALAQLCLHVTDLLERTDTTTHPVRAASLTESLVFAYLMPDVRKAERTRGRPDPVEVAAHAGVKFEDLEVDFSKLDDEDLIDVPAAMEHLARLVGLLPSARAYSVRNISRLFALFAPIVSSHALYTKVRDGLDTATAAAQGQATTAERCRDRGMAFVKAGKPLQALVELHNAKANWFTGDTLYGAVLTMRFIGKLYAGLGLMYAAKMYAAAAAAVTAVHGTEDAQGQLPMALLEAARYSQYSGCWVDGAAVTEVALLARAHYLPEPFDFENDAELENHRNDAVLELAAIRQFWPELEPLISAGHPRTGWFELLDEIVQGTGAEQAAVEQFAGPLFSDVGPIRIADFEALGVRWTFTFANDRTTVLAAEALVAALQVFLADIAPYHPVLISSTVRVHVDVRRDAGREVDAVDIDRSRPVIDAEVTLSADLEDLEAREHSVAALCVQLVDAVHARPAGDLQALLDPMFAAGLTHKLTVGRPYEEAADYLDDDHYARCAAATRPASSAGFRPIASPSLGPSTRTGAGYVRDEALRAIRERYEVASETLRYTLPRLLADDTCRKSIMQMRDAGWLDWQILVVLVNVAWNWRLRAAGLGWGAGNQERAMQLARQPETVTSPTIPLSAFAEDELSFHTLLQTHSVARRWSLQGRPEAPGEGAMRDLLVRRYEYAEDDVPHRDLLECVDEHGAIQILDAVDND
ncbi:hypothetical protein [Puerhibacterium sp. TATVAM-FAB25]|uniref:hypothetical protein n=1 Tax=Puerhibacterium sp. TATVAM-FAB25 TaxID=3093699 RepID=UPI00397A8971